MIVLSVMFAFVFEGFFWSVAAGVVAVRKSSDITCFSSVDDVEDGVGGGPFLISLIGVIMELVSLGTIDLLRSADVLGSVSEIVGVSGILLILDLWIIGVR